MHIARYTAAIDADVVDALPEPSVSHGTVTDGYTRTALPFFLQLRGHLCLHASGVLTPRGVVAFAGASGVGKSTLAASVVRRGYPQWADDAVAVSTRSGRPMSVRLPFSPRLSASADQFVSSTPAQPPVPSTSGELPEPLLAVFVLERTAGAPGVFAVDVASALKAVVDNSYRFSVEESGDRRRFLDNQLGLVAGATILRAHVRVEPARFAAVVDMVTATIETLPVRSHS
jgi:hypothetical protein